MTFQEVNISADVTDAYRPKIAIQSEVHMDFSQPGQGLACPLGRCQTANPGQDAVS